MASAAVTAQFRAMIRAVGPIDDDAQFCLDVAEAWVNDRVYPEDQDETTRHIDVTKAILILGHRLWNRRNSPEGVSGWGDLGVITIRPNDPDIRALLEQHIDHTKVGIA